MIIRLPIYLNISALVDPVEEIKFAPMISRQGDNPTSYQERMKQRNR
jgi:hypothetical protein